MHKHILCMCMCMCMCMSETTAKSNMCLCKHATCNMCLCIHVTCNMCMCMCMCMCMSETTATLFLAKHELSSSYTAAFDEHGRDSLPALQETSPTMT